MVAKSYKINLEKLIRAVKHGYSVLEQHRKIYHESVELSAGNRYRGKGNRRLVNLVGMFESIYGRNLFAKNPRFFYDTFDRQSEPLVTAMQDWANDELERQNFSGTMRECVVSALHGPVGVCKVSLLNPGEAANAGWVMQAGGVAIQPINIDDYVCDGHVRRPEEYSFEGHRFRMPREVALSMYGKKAKDLPVSDDPDYNAGGDERVIMMGRGSEGGDNDEFEDMVDLWEIYLPRYRVVVTLEDDGSGSPVLCKDGYALKEQGWVGPPEGPYERLRYRIVSGNSTGKGPIQDIVELDKDYNEILRKLVRQAKRQKELLLAFDDETVANITNASDGDALKSSSQIPAQVAEFGRVNQLNFVLADHLKEKLSWAAGNLDMLGGLSPQSKTATQDRILAMSASGGLAEMQNETQRFMSKIGNKMGWFWHHHPNLRMQSKYSPKSAPEFWQKREVGPMQRMQVSWEQMRIKVDPHSYGYLSPPERLNLLRQTLKDMMPILPLLMQQGISPDFDYYLKTVGKLTDDPDICRFLRVSAPMQFEGASGGGPGLLSAGDSGEPEGRVRENLSEQTPQGQSQNLMQKLMGRMGGAAERNGTY